MAWSHDGRYLASADDTGEVQIWKSADSKIVARVKLSNQNNDQIAVTSLAWSPDDSAISTSSDDGLRIWKWSDQANTPPTPLWNSGGSISLAWSPDGARLASGNDRGLIQIWSIGNDRPTTLRVGAGQSTPDAQVRSLAWTDNGTYMAGISSDGTLHRWKVAEQAPADELVHVVDTIISTVRWAEDGSNFAVGDLGGLIQTFDAHGKQLYAPISTRAGAPLDLAWSADHTMLASSGSNGRIAIWDGETGSLLTESEASEAGFLSLSWTPDGSQLAGGTSGRKVLIWHAIPEKQACETAVAKLSETTLTRSVTPVGLAACSNPASLPQFPPIPVLSSNANGD
jgi:WD40 repeat protein